MVGALGGVVLGLAFLRRRSAIGVAAAALALGGLRRARLLPAWRSSPATRCSPPRCWRSSPRSACSAGACSSPATPGAAPGRRSPLSSSLMFVALGTEPVRPPAPRRHRPHQPGRDRGRPRPTSPTPAPCRAALRPDRGPQPPRRPPSRLRPRHPPDPDRQRQRGALSPDRGYFLDPASALRRPQLHPRPQRPDPAPPRRPPRLPRGRPQRVLGPLQALPAGVGWRPCSAEGSGAPASSG